MSRTVLPRRVCSEPTSTLFSPEKPTAQVTLGVDQLEALRLCDLEGMEQDAAAQCMGVSRGTFQRMLYSARRTVAEALWEGKALAISGGNYILTQSGCPCHRGCRHCPKQCP